MAMKVYSTFPKAPRLGPHYKMQFTVIHRTLVEGGSYPLCRGTVGVFYNYCRQDEHIIGVLVCVCVCYNLCVMLVHTCNPSFFNVLMDTRVGIPMCIRVGIIQNIFYMGMA